MADIQQLDERVIKLEREFKKLFRSRAGLDVQPGQNVLGQDTTIHANLTVDGILTAAGISVVSISVHDHQTDALGGKLDHGAALVGLLDDDHTQYYNYERHTLTLHTGLGLVPNTLTLTAGNGLTGGGALNADLTFNVGAGTGITVAADTVAINQAFTPTWTGAHQFNANINASNVQPRTTDAYDLGSATLLWRKIYASEFDTVLFSQNTITLLGGWLMVSKGEGSVDVAVATGTTSIDFGAGADTLAVNDFILFRATGKVEYMKVTGIGAGNVRTVTRNVDGSGADTWAKGAPWVNLGNVGAGRIELNAYDTPRISILEQGATYNAQTERIRIGDLASWQGAGLTGYGLAIGDYSGNEYMAYSPGGGLIIRGTIRADDGFLGTLDVTGKLSLSTTGAALAVGTTPPASATSGTGLWLDKTGLYSLVSNVQVINISASTGALNTAYSSAGSSYAIELGNDGLHFRQFSDTLLATVVGWYWDGDRTGGIYGAGDSGENFLRLFSQRDTPSIGEITELVLEATDYESGGSTSTIVLTSEHGVGTSIRIESDKTRFTAVGGDEKARIANGLYVGRQADAGNGNIGFSGSLISYKNSTEYTGYVFVPLSTPLTSTSFDGDSFSTTAATLIDLSSVFGVPAGVKAILARVVIRDSGSAAGTDLYIGLGSSNSVPHSTYIRCSGMPNDVYVEKTEMIMCNSDGDIYYNINASGTNTMDVIIRIWGYWI